VYLTTKIVYLYASYTFKLGLYIIADIFVSVNSLDTQVDYKGQ